MAKEKKYAKKKNRKFRSFGNRFRLYEYEFWKRQIRNDKFNT